MTRLKSISISNFKAYKGLQEIPLKPLTLIFGPNSSGKSSIIHALAFLKHTYLMNGHCRPNEVDLVWDKVTLGGWQNLLHAHDAKQSMQLGIEFGNAISAMWTFESINQTPTATVCDIKQHGAPIACAKNDLPGEIAWTLFLENQSQILRLGDEIWNFLWTGDERSKASAKHEEKLSRECFDKMFLEHVERPDYTSSGLYPGATDKETRRERDEIASLRGYPAFVDSWNYSDGEKMDGKLVRECVLEAIASGGLIDLPLQQLFSHCFSVAIIKDEFFWNAPEVLAFERLFRSYVHLGPSREPPPRDIDSQSLAKNAQFGPWLELLKNKELREQVNQSLERLDLNYELVTRWKEFITYYPDSDESPPKYDSDNVEFSDHQKQLAFQIKNSRVTLSHRDLGYGVSMVLPILVALHSTQFNLITMEQPEMHIHPKQQAELGDELLMAALRLDKKDKNGKNKKKPTQLIIETHSEHLIRRILRRVRETSEGKMDVWPDALHQACPNGIHPKDLAVIYVKSSQDGAMVVPIRINELGEFVDVWPDGFFEERFDESL
jgi:hypothetical protein